MCARLSSMRLVPPPNPSTSERPNPSLRQPPERRLSIELFSRASSVRKTTTVAPRSDFTRFEGPSVSASKDQKRLLIEVGGEEKRGSRAERRRLPFVCRFVRRVTSHCRFPRPRLVPRLSPWTETSVIRRSFGDQRWRFASRGERGGRRLRGIDRRVVVRRPGRGFLVCRF